jgi:hypothetical protein
MKKLLALLVLLALPVFTFAAGFQIGAIGMYKGGFPPTDPITLQSFTYGAEARLSFGLLQGGATALYFPNPAGPANILALLDVGLNLNLAILDLGVGLGPNFAFPINAPGTAVGFGLNVKAAAEVNLGKIGIGAVGFWRVDKLSDLSVDFFKAVKPALGVTLLYRLF